MQSRQEKAQTKNTIQKKSAETATKASPDTGSATRMPAWANSWDNNVSASLTLDNSTLSRQDDSSNLPIAPSLMAPMAPFIQRATLGSAPTTTSATPAVNVQNTPATVTDQPVVDTVADSPVASPLIVEDDASDLKVGQMKRTEFLTTLREDVCKTADEALAGTIWSSVGCPWVTYWFGYYGNRSSQQIEKAIRRYTLEAASVTDARDYIPLISRRVRRAIATWSTTGEVTGVPEGVPTNVPQGSPTATTAATTSGTAPSTPDASTRTEGVQLKSSGDSRGTTADPEAIRGQLGEGHSLDGSIQSRLGSAFGTDFSHVRVHTEAQDAALSKDLNARAFTVGNDVAFGPGEYRPGTPVGDALIAHELAHVVQQRGASSSAAMSKSKDDAGYNALEADADRSAFGAIAAIWGGTKAALAGIGQNAMPQLQSGLSLRRCSGDSSKQSVLEDTRLDGVREDPDPGDMPAFVGTKTDIFLQWAGKPVAGLPQSGQFPRVRRFTIAYPSGAKVVKPPGKSGRAGILFLEVGNTEIRADVDIAPGQSIVITRIQRVVEPKEYTEELLAEFGMLYQRKESIIYNKTSSAQSMPGDELSEVNDRISKVIAQLHELGINLSEGEIYDKLKEGKKDFLEMNGIIVQSPPPVPSADRSDKYRLYPNERAEYRVQLDYIPPNRKVEVGWHWIVGNRKGIFAEFGYKNRGALGKSLDIAESFWLTEQKNISEAGGFELTADIYVGDSDTSVKTLSTGLIKVDQDLPEKLTLMPQVNSVLRGATLEFRIANWAYNFSLFSMNWEVNGKRVATDIPSLRYTFNDLGTSTVTAKIFQGHRSWGRITDETLFRQVEQKIEVQTAEKAAEEFFKQSDENVKVPTLGEVGASIPQTIEGLSQKVARSGDNAAYWKDRLQAQRDRLESFERNVPSQKDAKPLSGDLTSIKDNSTYSTAIPAVLAVPEVGALQPINMYLTIHGENGGWTASLLDISGNDIYPFEGKGVTAMAAIEAAFDTWMHRNPYPRGGTVIYNYSPPGWTKPKSFTTNSSMKTFKAWLDGVIRIGGAIAVGLLLLFPEPTGATKWLAYIVAAATIARSSIAIYENIELGIKPLDTRNILEGVAILTSFVGVGGTALSQLGIKGARPIVYTVGNWMVLGSLVSDAGTLVYATVEAIKAIQSIASDPTKDEGQKTADIMRIIGTLIIQGSLLILTNKELFKGGLKRADFIPSVAKEQAQAALRGEVKLDTAARLQIAAELRTAGEVPERLLKLSPRDLIDRYQALSWLNETLTREEVEQMLNRLSTDALVGLRDISAREAKQLVDQLGKSANFDAFAALLKGSRLRLLTNTLGSNVAQQVIDRLSVSQAKLLFDSFTDSNLARILREWVNRDPTLNHLIDMATSLELGLKNQGIAASLGPKSLVVDSNTVIAVTQYIEEGIPWNKLEARYQASINKIRAAVNLPPVDPKNPPERTLTALVGDAELVSPNIVLAESHLHKAPSPLGLTKNITLTVERNSPEYLAVLKSLETPPPFQTTSTKGKPIVEPSSPVGGEQGFSDRTAVADALFARTSGGPPKFITNDIRAWKGLAAFSDQSITIPNKKYWTPQDFAQRNPSGHFTATIPFEVKTPTGTQQMTKQLEVYFVID